jgi:hypothetical protein
MEPGSLVMERKMLLGIKRRAERLAAEKKEPTFPDYYTRLERMEEEATRDWEQRQ